MSSALQPQNMAVYASNEADMRGRFYPEPESTFRTAFQRDRDRIIHASAFRRLQFKTQVFVVHEGDYFRTRLTHSIEVAQVARTIARTLGLNQDLTEAIALAHDLGHTPFGHTGEDALARLMAPYGGFDHNAQAIRIVTTLERHYAEWDGLNLTWETLEGLAKHNGPVIAPIPYALAAYNARHNLELGTFAGGEAQVAALADDIAYNNHDLHDGLRAGLFTDDDICALPVVGACYATVDVRYPGLAPARRRHEALRRVFGVMVEDVIAQSRARLADLSPQTVRDIRAANAPVIRFSPALWLDLKDIRAFLFAHMYRAAPVVRMRARVTKLIEALFPLFMETPALLPEEWQEDVKGQTERAESRSQTALARLVADYIAGMTDSFAFQEHARLTGKPQRAGADMTCRNSNSGSNSGPDFGPDFGSNFGPKDLS